MKTLYHARKGFTLIELLLVIGIIAILAAIVIVAINPTKQLQDARNAQRRSDINTVLNAYWQYAIDNVGAFQPTTTPAGCLITSSAKEVCRSTTTITGCDTNDCVYSEYLSPTYVVGIPLDPQDDNVPAGHTAYTIQSTTAGRLTVTAPNTEPSTAADLTVSR